MLEGANFHCCLWFQTIQIEASGPVLILFVPALYSCSSAEASGLLDFYWCEGRLRVHKSEFYEQVYIRIKLCQYESLSCHSPDLNSFQPFSHRPHPHHKNRPRRVLWSWLQELPPWELPSVERISVSWKRQSDIKDTWRLKNKMYHLQKISLWETQSSLKNLREICHQNKYILQCPNLIFHC